MTDSPTPPRGRRRGSPLTEREEQFRGSHRVASGRHHHHRAHTGTEPLPTAGPAEPATAQVADADVAPADATRLKKTPSSYRAELQGLRAVAILMVVCYHIWFDRVSGGVDIFLLISAFLLTGSFVRKLEAGRPLMVVQYWAHAFKRLVAPAAAVIIATLGAIVLVYPPNRFADLVVQAFASLTYWENWHLALQGVDYYAADKSVASPFQHFWSLSIQGQVFFLWPLLFLLAAVLVRRFHLPVRGTLLTLFGAITVASFVWSVHLTATDQAYAYFDTRTRLWEFAFGSLLALVLPFLEKRWRGEGAPRAARGRAALGWVATLAILSCGWVVDVENAFPGYIALWPLLAACVVIAMGRTHTLWGVDRFLSSGPLRWVGDISYSLYLVHWPLLITTLLVLDVPQLNVWQGAAVVATSLLLGWLLTIGIDNPIRRWPWASARAWRSAIVIFSIVALGLTPVTALHAYTERSVPVAGSARYPGALSLLPDASPVTTPPKSEPFVPALEQLEDQWVWFDHRCQLPVEVSKGCDELRADDNASTTIVAFGNSHVQQFSGVIAPLAEENGWQIKRPTAGGCDYQLEAGSDDCREWNAQMRKLLLDLKPAAVLMQSTHVDAGHAGAESVVPGYPEAAQFLLDHGIEVIAVRDNPRFAESVPECIHREGAGSAACSLPRSALYAESNPAPALHSSTGARLYTVDLTDEYCPGGTCSPVIGNVLVYFDDNHVTRAYGRTLAPFAERQLREQGFDV